jgi:8-oxo-dGTP diphosphatase
VVGPLLVARSQVFPPRVDRGPLQAIQLVYEATASGQPIVTEEDGTTDEVAWVPLDTARSLALVELARWALRP